MNIALWKYDNHISILRDKKEEHKRINDELL